MASALALNYINVYLFKDSHNCGCNCVLCFLKIPYSFITKGKAPRSGNIFFLRCQFRFCFSTRRTSVSALKETHNCGCNCVLCFLKIPYSFITKGKAPRSGNIFFLRCQFRFCFSTRRTSVSALKETHNCSCNCVLCFLKIPYSFITKGKAPRSGNIFFLRCQFRFCFSTKRTSVSALKETSLLRDSGME